jgi:hypothetical protein
MPNIVKFRTSHSPTEPPNAKQRRPVEDTTFNRCGSCKSSGPDGSDRGSVCRPDADIGCRCRMMPCRNAGAHNASVFRRQSWRFSSDVPLEKISPGFPRLTFIRRAVYIRPCRHRNLYCHDGRRCQTSPRCSSCGAARAVSALARWT